MNIAVVRLVATTSAAHPDLAPETLTDIIWAAATPADGIEHVRARAGPRPGCIDLVLFRKGALSASCVPATRVCERAITASPRLSGWTVSSTDSPHSYSEGSR